jgi:hypothetical protein
LFDKNSHKLKQNQPTEKDKYTISITFLSYLIVGLIVVCVGVIHGQVSVLTVGEVEGERDRERVVLLSYHAHRLVASWGECKLRGIGVRLAISNRHKRIKKAKKQNENK